MSKRTRMDCSHCPVADRAACAVLAPHERETLERLGSGRLLRKGEMLFAPGRGSSECATLISGALKIVDYDRDGHETIVSLVHPAGFTGELFAADDTHAVIALTDCRLCVFPAAAYRNALEQFPALSLALLRRTSGELAEARNMLSLAGFRSAQARLAGLLIALGRAASHSPCHPASRFDLVLSRSEMAGLIGLTIETVSRQLTALERAGHIRRDGRRGIELTDIPALEALAA